MAPASIGAGRRRADLQGLRALAVGLVMADHFGAPGVPGGYVGVDIFFVLSGFLITGLLLDSLSAGRPICILGFYARRARRIFPVAALVVLTTVVMSAVLSNVLQARAVQMDGPWVALFAANLHFSALGTDYLTASTAPSPLQHYWSLAVEEQFYLVVPAVVIALVALARSHARRAVGAMLATASVTSLAYSIHATGVAPKAAYFSTFARAFELGSGGVLAAALPYLVGLGSRHPRLTATLAQVLGCLGLVGIGWCAIFYTPLTAFPGYAATLPVISTGSVVLAGSLSPHVGVLAPLRSRAAGWLGTISFSLYLWHWPLLVLGEQVAGGRVSGFARLLLVVLTIVLANVTYLLVERPCQRWRLLIRRPVVSLAAGLALLVTAAMVPASMAAETTEDAPHLTGIPVSVLASHASTPLSAVVQAVQLATQVTVLPALRVPLVNVASDRSVAYTDGCHTRVGGTRSALCAYGGVAARRTIVLYGDSHATQWLPALDLIGRRQHWKVVLITKSGCPLPRLPGRDYNNGRPYPACDSFRGLALPDIARIHPALLVVANLFPGVYAAATPAAATRTWTWTAGLSSELRALRPLATRVAYLRDIPTPLHDPVQCLAAQTSNIRVCASSPLTALHLNDGFENAVTSAVRAAGAHYVNTTPWFCTVAICPAVIDSASVYFDAGHLSATYSAELAGVLGASLHLS